MAIHRAMMYAAYTLILLLSLIVLSPYFVYQAIRHKKYFPAIKQRLGVVRQTQPAHEPTIWLHAVSVGEALAVHPLVQKLHETLKSYRLVVSTTTTTGQALAQRRFSDWADVIYFPLDVPFSIRRILEDVSPSLVLIVETEIWPNFLRVCSHRGIPVFLVNGRISDRSFQRYYMFRLLVERVLNDFTLLLMQSQRDADRMLRLGADPERVVVTGNLKYDLVAPDLSSKLVELDRALDLSQSRLIVAGSTARGEEALLLDAFATLSRRPMMSEVRFLMAPRHPERFDEVEGLIRQTGFSFSRRSQAQQTQQGRNDKIILLDTLGELAAVYAAADVVFVGGSLVPIGGHNVLEPALFGKPIIVGPYTSNFQAIVEELIEEEAIIQLEPSTSRPYRDQLAEAFHSLLTDPTRSQRLGENASAGLARNRGATERTLSSIIQFLHPTSTEAASPRQ